MAWGIRVEGAGGGTTRLTVWPSRSRAAGFAGAPSTVTQPSAVRACMRERDRSGQRWARKVSSRSPASSTLNVRVIAGVGLVRDGLRRVTGSSCRCVRGWIPAPYRVRGRLFVGMTDAVGFGCGLVALPGE